MPDVYRIVQIPSDIERIHEQMGTKFKFWCDLDGFGRVLFKEGHSGTGEDWAERVSADLCALLEIPHAQYELASWRGRRGVISSHLLSVSQTLSHGNAVLFGYDASYPVEQRRGVTKHTLERIFSAFDDLDVRVPTEFSSGSVPDGKSLFVGYLMFDAWIGNTDRHHENWAVIRSEGSDEVVNQLAPSHDHAASFGCILTEYEASERLSTKDRGRSISHYVTRGASAIYSAEDAIKPLSLIDAFKAALYLLPEAGQAWLSKLEAVDIADAREILNRVLSQLISTMARRFAVEMLSINRKRLLSLK